MVTLNSARALTLAVGLIWGAPIALGQDYELERPPEATQFATSVDIDGERIVVGGGISEPDGPLGAAWVYEFDGEAWHIMSRLTAGPAGAEWFFGEAVAIAGDRILIGAPGADTSATPPKIGFRPGRTYLYEWDGESWEETAQLELPGTKGFGGHVEFDGDRLGILSFFFADDPPGYFHIFEEEGGAWKEVARLTSPDAQATRASFDGPLVVVDDGGQYRIYPFVNVSGEWLPGTPMVAPNGGGLVVDDGRMLTCENSLDGGAGVFEWDGKAWNSVGQLFASGAPDGFGVDCDIDGDLAIVATTAGTTYVFAHASAGWEEVSLLYGEGWTAPVAIDGDRAVADGIVYEGLVRNNVATEETAEETARSASALYPNPSSDYASINFTLRVPSRTSVEVFDALGRRIADTDMGVLSRGFHRLPLDLSTHALGIYLVRLTTGDEVATHTLTVIR